MARAPVEVERGKTRPSARRELLRRSIVLVWLFAPILATGCSARGRAVREVAPLALCFASLESCASAEASFVAWDGDRNAGRTLPGGGTVAGQVVTVSYRVPLGLGIFVLGESTVQRVATRHGVVEALAAPVHVAASERPVDGRFLVEVTLGAGRALWANPVFAGTEAELAEVPVMNALGGFVLAGFLAFGAVQQGLTWRRARVRTPVAALAAAFGVMSVRAIVRQFRFTPLWEGMPYVARTAEILAIPVMVLALGSFYFWVAGVEGRSRRLRAWWTAGGVVVAFLVASNAVPSLRAPALDAAYAFMVVTTAMVAWALRGAWPTLHPEDRKLTLLGCLVATGGAILDVALIGAGRLVILGIVPIGFAVEAVCQAELLARRNGRAHDRVDELSGELTGTNTALRVAHDSLAESHAELARDAVVLEAELDERRRLQGALDRATGQLTQAESMATLGMLMAGIAHDLRNPLNYMQGAAQVLRSSLPALGSDDPSERADAVGRVQKVAGWVESGTASMGALTVAMRNQARSGDRELVVIAVGEVVHEALLLCASRTSFCALEVEADDTAIAVDPTGLGQLVMNLVSNAADALVEARDADPDRPATIRVSAHVDGKRFCLVVEDSGPGIPTALRTRILEPFFTTKPRGEGTGLGLAIVQRVIKENGGTLEVGRSEDLGGARFEAAWVT